jgi:hypothetical protein
VLPPTHPSYRQEIVDASRRKYSIPKDDAAKLIAEEEATIIRSSEEKAIIEGRAKRLAREAASGGSEVEEQESGEKENLPAKSSQEAEPMI